MTRRQGGFTLIELITVIIILGILATIIAPRFFGMADNARVAANEKALSDGIVHFNLAYMHFVVENGTAPTNLTQLSGVDYLGLNGSGQVVAADYRFTYSLSGSTMTVSSQRDNGSGGWEASLSQTFDWP